MNFFNKIYIGIDRANQTLFHFAGILTLILILLIVSNVITRYLFKTNYIGLQELQWHLFGAIFLLGAPYLFKTNGHVRVDIFYANYSKRKKAIIDILGSIIFLIPVTGIIIYFGFLSSSEAFQTMEGSRNPGGLEYRWVIRSFIPLGAFLLFLQGISSIIQNVSFLSNPPTTNNQTEDTTKEQVKSNNHKEDSNGI